MFIREQGSHSVQEDDLCGISHCIVNGVDDDGANDNDNNDGGTSVSCCHGERGTRPKLFKG